MLEVHFWQLQTAARKANIVFSDRCESPTTSTIISPNCVNQSIVCDCDKEIVEEIRSAEANLFAVECVCVCVRVDRIPNRFCSRKRKSSEMNKSCARCTKVVYNIEELKCLDKVCDFFLPFFPLQSCVVSFVRVCVSCCSAWPPNLVLRKYARNSHHYVDYTNKYIYHLLSEK